MRTVYLGNLRPDVKALPIWWLVERFGPSGDRWTLRELAYVDFRKDRDADLFLLTWA